MDFEGIPPVGSPGTAPGVNQRSQSGKRDNPEPDRASNPEPQPATKDSQTPAVEFSEIDPVIGLTLAEVTPAACKKVAQKIKEILPD
jgi:hypothetical protein